MFVTQGEKESVAGMIFAELHQDRIAFSAPHLQKIYTAIIEQIESAGLIDIQKLTNHSNNEISKQAVDLIAQAHYISKNWKQKHNIITGRENERLQKTTEKAILSLKKGIVDFQISEMQQQLKSGEFNTNSIKKLNSLTKLKTQISKLLGRNIG